MSGPLRNPRHERLALEKAKGTPRHEALEALGMSPLSGSSVRLWNSEKIEGRASELRTAVQAVVIERTGITEARIVDELAKIAFADIRKVVKWQPEQTEHIDENDDGDIITITRTIQNRVQLVGSEVIDDATAGAVAAVSLSSNGTLTVKMHDKMAALKILEERMRPAVPSAINNGVINNFAAFIDAPPAETYEQWAERTRRLRDGNGARNNRTLEATGRSTS